MASDPVAEAWAELRDPRAITEVHEISATVSTNHVYRVHLEDGKEVIAKTSSYGSYVHFRQDHQLIQQWGRLLSGTRFSDFLAPVVERQGEVFTYHHDDAWVVFYKKAPFYDFLPRILPESYIDAFAREMALFHRHSLVAAPKINPAWKSLGSDIAALYDSLSNRAWCAARDIDRATHYFLRAQCETFLLNAEKLGYHRLAKIPILMDWNIGNFSVGLDQAGFKFYSRWDYDWFRVEPRALDFYFCARVVRNEGDRTLFTYSVGPLLEPRFGRFLHAYHQINPLHENEVLFLKEAYRFFVLNYVVRSGEHFFRTSYFRRLQHEVITLHLPELDRTDFSPLLRNLD